MVLKTLFFIVLLFDSYMAIWIMTQNHLLSKLHQFVKIKDDNYYQNLLKNAQKRQKIKTKAQSSHVQRMMLRIRKNGLKHQLIFNPVFLFLLSIMSFIFCLIIVNKFLKTPVLALIVSVPTLAIPIYLLEFMDDLNFSNVEKSFLNFLLQLKNYTNINNDIVYAMQEVKTIEPMQSYISIFLMEIHNGIPFEIAINNLSNMIDSETFKQFFANITHCYLYGGDFSKLISQSYDIIYHLQKEKEKRVAETKNARIVLGLLVLLDLFVYFTNIKNNYQNYLIMRKTFFGNVILYWNFISLWFLLILSRKVKKLDY